MLPSGLSWAAFASLVLGASCANDFVTSGNGTRSFPREFGLNLTTKVYWTNSRGYIAGIYVHTNGQSDDSADYDWVLAPNCSEDSDSGCTAYDNSGSASFFVNGTAVPLGSGYQLRLLWTTSKSYDDIDDDTEEVTSPEFGVVPADEINTPDHPGGLGPAEQAGIAIAVVVVVLFLILVVWFRSRKEKRRKKRRERQLQNRAARDEGHAGWYERWTMGKRKDTEDSWTAGNLPAKPSPAVVAAGVRKASKTGSDGQPYIDDKAEMPTDGGNRHEIDSYGTSAARNKTELDGTSAPLAAAVELPAEPVSGQTSSRTASTATSGTLFEYNPSPSYALQPPGSPQPEAGLVSPLSEGVGTYNSLAGSVSPVTPISRKPVGGTVRTIPEQQQQQQQQYLDPEMAMTDGADGAPKRGRTALLRKEKSRIWKMLGGGSTKGKLNPASGANIS
ncbi:hypothetical protein Daus18300_007653 [Diaporthe australafricana]|uniref:Uncharacterized protein n=1 Tax=Diaporthe australafricana TaxID=127596 RepID=A0ABR3WLA5_9PEZI